MQKEILEQWNKTSTDTYNAIQELSGITGKIAEKITQQQFNLASVYMDAGVKSINIASESKGYKDLMTGQAALVSDLNDKALSFARSTTSILSESKDELSAWSDKGLQAVTIK